MKKIVLINRKIEKNKKGGLKMKQKFDVSTAKNPEHLFEFIKKLFQDKTKAIELVEDKIIVTMFDKASFKEKFSLIQSISSFIRERQALESMGGNL